MTRLTIICLVLSVHYCLAAGVLRQSAVNGNYFTDDSGRAVYLTGSHTWANMQDGLWTSGAGADPPPAFDFTGYLDFMQARNHNFIRLWSSELPKLDEVSFGTGFYFPTPHPWARTGPGNAADGKLKFDLTLCDQAYFDRLRARVIAARERGIYVSITLFEGWHLNSLTGALGWNFSPFRSENNINSINGDTNGNGQGFESHSLSIAGIVSLHEAYIRKTVDTVNDLDNVLYEISNEEYGGTAARDWQYYLIDYLNTYQAEKPKQHPVGMTAILDGATHHPEWLDASNADWIAKGSTPWDTNPPIADGDKVNIPDTDHIFGVGGDATWVWKIFLRGHNPIYMDPYGNPGFPAASESARNAMGYTRTTADRMDLIHMVPSTTIASTQYCLFRSGVEYLVYAPSAGSFTVNLSAGAGKTFRVEWINPGTGAITNITSVAGGSSAQSFSSPINNFGAVLHLSVPSGARKAKTDGGIILPL